MRDDHFSKARRDRCEPTETFRNYVSHPILLVLSKRYQRRDHVLGVQGKLLLSTPYQFFERVKHQIRIVFVELRKHMRNEFGKVAGCYISECESGGCFHFICLRREAGSHFIEKGGMQT